MKKMTKKHFKIIVTNFFFSKKLWIKIKINNWNKWWFGLKLSYSVRNDFIKYTINFFISELTVKNYMK